jgi:hypothetical protein
MSNFLEKWRGNADTTAEASAERRVKRDEVLKAVRLERELETRHAAPASSAPQHDARAIFEQLCVCAIEDRNFIVRYEEQSNGLFRAKESVKIYEGQESGGTGRARATVVLSTDQIEGDHTPCPWCGDSGHYHCSCGGVVCGGRVVGELFICRESCGDRWIIGMPVTEIKGTKSQQERRESKAPPRPISFSSAQPKSATENRLLLGPAGELSGKKVSSHGRQNPRR